MRHTAQPLSLAKLLKEVDGLIFLVQRLDGRVVAAEQSTREEIEAKLLQARHQLAEIIIQRTD